MSPLLCARIPRAPRALQRGLEESREGKEVDNQVRTLTRQFPGDTGKNFTVTKPPIYVYGRPAGETPEGVGAFKEMLNDEMKSAREMWKFQLPFSAESNDFFAEEALKRIRQNLEKGKPPLGSQVRVALDRNRVGREIRSRPAASTASWSCFTRGSTRSRVGARGIERRL
jgi:hypothetical protein